ncbi:hypothetical protein [Intestinibacillus massiliensis]|uniref:hypothetical protein n=1 Tax=Intestinibacillus massiliensis TaxID=1871029 RepID=UPI00117B0577|nr:hypothetical protein [Intestinibacillus massiliensis]
MKKIWKKFLSMGITLTLLLGMATTAFAVETKTYSIKEFDGTSLGTISITNVVSDNIKDGIYENAETYTIQVTKDSLITYNIRTSGLSISQNGEDIWEQESVVKVSNAKVLSEDEGIIDYEAGYTIQFIKTGTYTVGMDGHIGTRLGSGWFPIVFKVTDGTSSTTPPPATAPITASPTSSKVLVNGSVIEFDAYTINGNNYFKLRDIAQVVSGSGKQFEVTWNGAKNAIELVSGQPYTVVGGELAKGDGTAKNAIANTSAIYKDGVVVELTAYTINGNNYFKLRDLGQSFDFNVSWDGINNCIVVNTSEGYTAD